MVVQWSPGRVLVDMSRCSTRTRFQCCIWRRAERALMLAARAWDCRRAVRACLPRGFKCNQEGSITHSVTHAGDGWLNGCFIVFQRPFS